ncbi:MAG: 50S ribosomal protein L6 [Candidatus Shapirobacteria bacterium]|jgi:large subunit ribosomal protein L6
MSRLAKKSLTIPSEVAVTQDQFTITITGPKGKLVMPLPAKIEVKVDGQEASVRRLGDDRQTRANLGTTWSILKNHLAGVVTPWQKSMEIRGTGYKFAIKENILVITCGFIHPVEIKLPEGVTAVLTEETKAVLTGCNREIVGQVASNIRKAKPPEPYKGKGIRYLNEFVKLKAGKTAKA